MTGYRVLIADDEAGIVELLKDQLQALGHTPVGAAYDGQQAVDLAASLRPELILMDIRMPVLDGLLAAERIAIASPTPVLIVTAYMDWLQSVPEVAGVCGLLCKPWRLAHLERSIQAAVSGYHSDHVQGKLECGKE